MGSINRSLMRAISDATGFLSQVSCLNWAFSSTYPVVMHGRAASELLSLAVSNVSWALAVVRSLLVVHGTSSPAWHSQTLSESVLTSLDMGAPRRRRLRNFSPEWITGHWRSWGLESDHLPPRPWSVLLSVSLHVLPLVPVPPLRQQVAAGSRKTLSLGLLVSSALPFRASWTRHPLPLSRVRFSLVK